MSKRLKALAGVCTVGLWALAAPVSATVVEFPWPTESNTPGPDKTDETLQPAPGGDVSRSLNDSAPLFKQNGKLPEPAAWFMMMGGVGLIGYSLRRQARGRQL
jgi:PEP-CTERM motif